MATLQLGSDTLAGTATAGQVEYNGTIQTFTPLGTQRGVVPAEQFFSLNSGLAGANATGAQSIFGVGVTLSASTVYEFEMVVALSKLAGTTAHTIALSFGGTSTVNNIGYYVVGKFDSNFIVISPSDNQLSFIQTIASTAITSSAGVASLAYVATIKGTVSINAGGTFIPQYTLSAAPGGAYTTQAGSYIKIKPIGVSGANVSVGTWA